MKKQLEFIPNIKAEKVDPFLNKREQELNWEEKEFRKRALAKRNYEDFKDERGLHHIWIASEYKFF